MQCKINNLSFMGPLMHLTCSSLGFSHGFSWWCDVLCILDSTMFTFCSSRDLSLVSASPNGLGSFLGDLCKLEFHFHSGTFPARLHGTTAYRTFLLLSFYMLSKKYYLNTKEVVNLCQFSFICWKSLSYSHFFLHYLQTRRNCTQCFLFNYHYSIVMNMPPTQTTHFLRTGVIGKSEIPFSLSLPCYWIKRK